MWEPSGIERKDSCFLSPALESRRQRSNVAFMRTRTIVLVRPLRGQRPGTCDGFLKNWPIQSSLATITRGVRHDFRVFEESPLWVSTAHLTLGARERTSLS